VHPDPIALAVTPRTGPAGEGDVLTACLLRVGAARAVATADVALGADGLAVRVLATFRRRT
jgi:hypothetical protein